MFEAGRRGLFARFLKKSRPANRSATLTDTCLPSGLAVSRLGIRRAIRALAAAAGSGAAAWTDDLGCGRGCSAAALAGRAASASSGTAAPAAMRCTARAWEIQESWGRPPSRASPQSPPRTVCHPSLRTPVAAGRRATRRGARAGPGVAPFLGGRARLLGGELVVSVVELVVSVVELVETTWRVVVSTSSTTEVREVVRAVALGVGRARVGPGRGLARPPRRSGRSSQPSPVGVGRARLSPGRGLARAPRRCGRRMQSRPSPVGAGRARLSPGRRRRAAAASCGAAPGSPARSPWTYVPRPRRRPCRSMTRCRSAFERATTRHQQVAGAGDRVDLEHLGDRGEPGAASSCPPAWRDLAG